MSDEMSEKRKSSHRRKRLRTVHLKVCNILPICNRVHGNIIMHSRHPRNLVMRKINGSYHKAFLGQNLTKKFPKPLLLIRKYWTFILMGLNSQRILQLFGLMTIMDI